MFALATRFLAGRYHGTPWGRHVNEGAPEWPPSPYRILRALVATWMRKLAADPACRPGTVEALLRELCAPPLFVLPPAATGHMRLFMPLFGGKRTLVFDAFVALDRATEVVAIWPDLTLGPEERAAADRIAAHVGFLGRAESWAEARVLDESEAARSAERANCAPLNGPAERGREPVRVLCADPATAFGNEHTPKHVVTEGRGKSKRTIETPLYDPDWHLCMETLALHEERWSMPPGARWVTYARPSDCFAIAPRAAARRSTRPAPTVARFLLDSPVLPLVAETLRVAEQARITAMGCYRRAEEQRAGGALDALPRSPVLSGKAEDGTPLAGHGHARYLPTDEDGDGRIDHLTIVAERGFAPGELRALERMRLLRLPEREPVRIVLLGLERIEASAAPLLGPSRIWISATPFLATRHAKRRGRKRDPDALLGPAGARAFARQVLLEELARFRERHPEIPEPIAVEPLNAEHRCGAHLLRPIQFRRFRRKRGDDGGRRAAGAFRIVFGEPVRGPICLGHSSHFGLGLFVPE